jgi:acyl carrier protein
MLADRAEHSTDDLSDWLAERVAFYLDREPDDIDPTVPLAEYGVDSVYVVSVFGEVEERFGLVVEPTAAWDYPTLEALAEHLAGRLAAEAPA